MISIGIDVGTTTTQVVLSRLQLAALSVTRTTARSRVLSREILYQAEIIFTPLISADAVDAAAICAHVRAALTHAGLHPADVHTGAVIVTGEIAKTHNAAALVRELSALAGDFVVSTAGPDLEAVMAGRGSGAAAWAAEHFSTVVNVDVGGGTSNAARFSGTQLTGTSAINIGGRLIVIDPVRDTVQAIAAPAAHLIAMLGLDIQAGGPAYEPQLRILCAAMADGVFDLLTGHRSELTGPLQLSPGGIPPSLLDTAALLSFSGGVGSYIYADSAGASPASWRLHGDIGPMLGRALRSHPLTQRFAARGRLLQHAGQQLHRATVLGAAQQTVTLSGTTIWHSPGALPVRDLHVVELIWQPTQTSQAWSGTRYTQPTALAVPLPAKLNYSELRRLSQDLALHCAACISPDQPCVIVLSADYGQILGARLTRLAPKQSWVVIDQVGLEIGDRIDIGLPTDKSGAVPLSLKTLVFY